MRECVVAKSDAVLAEEWSLPFEILRIFVMQLLKMGIPELQVNYENMEAPNTAVKGWNYLLQLVNLPKN